MTLADAELRRADGAPAREFGPEVVVLDILAPDIDGLVFKPAAAD